jgi:LPXTG-motif cell wall-anchored protein
LENNNNSIHKAGRRRKVIFVIASILLVAFGLIALVSGAAVAYLNMGTDSEGYALSEKYQIETSSNALALWVAPLRITGVFSALDSSNIAATKWVVTTSEPAKEVFVGWAKASDVESYLSGFSYETPDKGWHWQTIPYAPEIDVPSTAIYNQGTPSIPPAEESFWTNKAATTNSAEIKWDPVWDSTKGMNVVVVMNADGSSAVNADIQLGFKVPILSWLPYLLIPIGILLLVLGLLLFKRRKRK